MVYARSLAQEGGFHYNTGVPEAGMTSPLWVVILSALHLPSTALSRLWTAVGAKLIGLLFGLGGILALVYICRTVDASVSTTVIATCLFAMDPSQTFSRVSGMEVPLFIFLVLAAHAAALRSRPIVAGCLVGLSTVARPEGFIIVPIILLLAFRNELSSKRYTLHLALGLTLSIVLSVVPASIYALYCWTTTQALLANTYYAKAVFRSPLTLSTLAFAWQHYVTENLPYFTLHMGAILSILGTWRLFRKNGIVGLSIPATGAILFLSVFATRPVSPGHYYYWERWVAPSLPYLLLLIASGTSELLHLARSSRMGQYPSVALVAVVVTLLVWRIPQSLVERASEYAWNCQNIEEMNVSMGEWINASLPKNAVIAVDDAGAIRYFGQRKTIDLTGLNNHWILHLLHSQAPHQIEILRDFGVHYFAVFPKWFPVELIPQLKLIVRQKFVAKRYTICSNNRNTLVLCETHAW
jgi:arabinofuranosyltransferase